MGRGWGTTKNPLHISASTHILFIVPSTNAILNSSLPDIAERGGGELIKQARIVGQIKQARIVGQPTTRPDGLIPPNSWSCQ